MNFKQFPTEKCTHTDTDARVRAHTHAHIPCLPVQKLKKRSNIWNLYFIYFTCSLQVVLCKALQGFPNNWMIYVGKPPQVSFEKVHWKSDGN